MADLSENDARELAYLPPSAPPVNHGHTTAAWVTTITVLIGVVAAALAVLNAMVWLFWVGMGIAFAGIVTGKVLAILGFGQPNPNDSTNQRDVA